LNDKRQEILAKLNASAPSSRARATVESHGSYEIIRPRITLKDKAAIYTDRPGVMNHAAIDRAEKALEELSSEFFTWMDEEVVKLQKAYDDLEQNSPSSERMTKLFKIVHEIRGCASTFGFPFATSVANGLAQIILYCDQKMPPIGLINSHVSAIRAIVREDARGSTDTTARALSDQLHIITLNYLAQLNPISRDDAKQFLAQV
jgi:hypothetical protein